MKKKGVYLITEKGCLNPETGAYQHISIGFSQLGYSYDIVYYSPFESHTIEESVVSKKPIAKNGFINTLKKGCIAGLIRDIYLLIKQNLQIRKTYVAIKKLSPDFIYERASFLDYRGLIIAKLLKIPHFYEVNGIQFQKNRKYYKSAFEILAKQLEVIAYRLSTHVFFVGTYGNYFKLSTKNWSNIENGVEKNLLQHAKYAKTQNIDGKINLCFIANLMHHQRADLLVEALKMSKLKSNIHLHLIGSGLEPVQNLLRNDVDVTLHGFVTRTALSDLMLNMHIGVIAGTPEFQSTMKLYDYACFKCIVIAPDAFNLKYWFDEELIFFKKSDAEDFAEKIDFACKNYTMLDKGLKLYEKVAKNFTWEAIYSTVTAKINDGVALNNR